MTCPHCGYEADPDQPACPLCGSRLDEGGGSGSVPPSSAPGDRDGGTPWEVRGGPRGLLRSWWRSLIDPGRFYSRVDWSGGLDRPVLYFLVFSVVGAGFDSLWHALLTPTLLSALGAEELLRAAGGSQLLSFFLSPFKALFWLGLAAAGAQLGAVVLAERRRSVGATARALCYASGPQLLRAVPFLGGLVAFFWSAVLAVIGLREAHRTSTARAVGSLATASLLLLFVMVLVTALVLGAGLGGSLPVTLPGGS